MKPKKSKNRHLLLFITARCDSLFPFIVGALKYKWVFAVFLIKEYPAQALFQYGIVS